MKLKFKKGTSSGSAYSNDLKENPIYFYYDKKNRENPIGIGLGEIVENNQAEKDNLTIEKMDEAEYITIDSKRYNYNKLIKKTISVKDIDYNEETKTIYITSDSELSQAIYDKRTRDLFKTIEKELGTNLIKNKKFLIISEKSKPMLFTINKLSMTESAENTSELHVNDVSFDAVDPIYLLDGKEVKKEEFTSIAPEKVKKMNVIKNKDKIEKLGYNPDEVPGIIEVTTKE
ncbi:MAG: hypothetical protein L0J60_04815 [Psychroflexus sp.]|nr:hypothetical protein [Psychroflexus sp.]